MAPRSWLSTGAQCLERKSKWRGHSLREASKWWPQITLLHTRIRNWENCLRVFKSIYKIFLRCRYLQKVLLLKYYEFLNTELSPPRGEIDSEMPEAAPTHEGGLGPTPPTFQIHEQAHSGESRPVPYPCCLHAAPLRPRHGAFVSENLPLVTSSLRHEHRHKGFTLLTP